MIVSNLNLSKSHFQKGTHNVTVSFKPEAISEGEGKVKFELSASSNLKFSNNKQTFEYSYSFKGIEESLTKLVTIENSKEGNPEPGFFKVICTENDGDIDSDIKNFTYDA